jgi:hypothetical protein
VLAKAAANNTPLPKGTLYQIFQALATQTTAKPFKIIMITESEDWRHLIIDYLNNTHHLEDKASATRIVAMVRSYTIMDDILYKRGVVRPLLKCITQSEGRELLQEIHSGMCGSHIGPRALSAKAIRQGFYWPTHIKDAEQIVKTCEAC